MVLEKWSPTSDIDNLPDEQFIAKYPLSGFGWDEAPNPNDDPQVAKHNAASLAIRRRHERLKGEKPNLYKL
jgi:hypothetical protein